MSNSNNTEKINNNIDINLDLIDLYFSKTDKRDSKAEITPKSYYLPNRPGFIKSIHEEYKDYILKAKDDSDDLDSTYKDLFPHQKFVRDYLQYQSPSRGLLLFHGLGVGKTCASIAAAELLLNNKNVTVMLPASLETNYINEVIKCGHKYYAPEQHWRFIPKKNLKDLNKLKKITIIDDIIIKRNKGLWYAVEKKASNFKNLGDNQKEQIMNQLNNIVKKKYNILHYNGINSKKLNDITSDNTINPFDDNIIIIDEVHNFISRVINSSKIAEKIYSLLMNAKNCKLLCLSGTPMINKPFEIALLLNLLKGRINIYELGTKQDIDEDNLELINKKLSENKYIDFFDYNAIDKILRIKLLPNKFMREDAKSKSMKVKYTEEKNLNDIETLANILKVLKKFNFNFKIKNNNIPKKFTMLPNNEKDFLEIFVDKYAGEITNKELFTKRILGAVSFFEYTDSELFPSIRKNEIVKVDFSDIQLKKYIDVRRNEISKESRRKNQTGQELKDEEGQVYKAFSRALCNFTFPEEINRPYPSELKLLLNDMDEIDEYHKKTKFNILKDEEKQSNVNTSEETEEEIDEIQVVKKPKKNIEVKTEKTEKPEKPEIKMEEPISTSNILDKFFKDKDIKFVNEEDCSSKKRSSETFIKKDDLINTIKKYPELVKKLPNNFEKLKKEDICKELFKLKNKTTQPKTGGTKDRFKQKNYDPADYTKKIKEVLDELSNDSDRYLVKELALYSPKFAKMVELINESEGSSLVYSQFRNVEGIGIFKRVLDANGYAQFKIKKGNGYELDIKEEDYNKPKYVEFTGDKEMTNVLLDIFNNNMDNIPDKIKEQLNKLHSNKNSEKKDEGNIRGSIIKVMMITQSGSEGISLKNVRQVHLVEPYWNMIRMDQVIGRAARTGSHLALPKKDRNIDVYRYLCKFSDKQLEERKIQRMDKGKTTDEMIYEGAERKAKITNQILELLKESAVDCYLHKKNHQDVTCFSYPVNIDDNELSVEADIYTDLENLKNKNKEEIKLSVSVVSIKNKKYAILKDTPRAKTGQLFDYETYVQFGNLEFVGLLVKNENDKLVLKLKKNWI